MKVLRRHLFSLQRALRAQHHHNLAHAPLLPLFEIHARPFWFLLRMSGKMLLECVERLAEVEERVGKSGIAVGEDNGGDE